MSSTTFSALEVPNYRTYAAGALVSNVGTWLQNTAQTWLVLQLTDSGSAVGFAIALQLLPSLLFSPIAGVLADRFDKRTLMSWLQVAMAVPSGVLGVLAIVGEVQLWQVYVLAFCFGTARAFEAPARQSFVGDMVGPDQLSNAVALNSASFNSGRLIGPALAGLMIAVLGSGVAATGYVIAGNAISFGFVLLALRRLDPALLHESSGGRRGRGAVAEGVRYVRGRPDLLLLLGTVFFLGAFGMNFQITTALMATDVFNRGAGEFGLLGSFVAIGSLTGSLLAARRPRPRLRFVVGAGLAFCVVQVTSGLVPTYLTYAIVMPFIGLTVLTTVTTANALIQLTSAPVMRGRVAALYLMVFLGSTPVGAPFIGWVAELYGPRIALVVSGVLAGTGITACALWFLRHDSRPLARLRERRRRGTVTRAAAPRLEH
jgi:MFS family permease